MIHYINEEECCGCGACSVVCPKNCITLEEGSLGHLFARVNQTSCVECGLCEKVCPILAKRHVSSEIEQSAFAAYAKEDSLRFCGSSGGLFGVFARYLMEQGYVVYGAAFDSQMKLVCTSAETLEDLKPMYKSKYLQSDLRQQYKVIQEHLNNGDSVFFISTPCQVAALKCFLSKDYANLFTVDFFCHGVPSQKFFDQCMQLEERKSGGKVTWYEFRTKKKRGATPHYFTEEIQCASGKKLITGLYFQSAFYAIFQKYINLRESCYHCRFADRHRMSDITIGDFHDIDKYMNGINRFDGVSTVIVNTPKGLELWKKCQEMVNAFPMSLERLIADGACFGTGTERPVCRNQFIKDYESMDMEELVRKWANPKAYWKQAVYYKMPDFIRCKIKRFLGV